MLENTFSYKVYVPLLGSETPLEIYQLIEMSLLNHGRRKLITRIRKPDEPALRLIRVYID